MATFNKVHYLSMNMARGLFDLATDTLRVYLSNAAPVASQDNDKADLAEIASGNGYVSNGLDIANVASRAAATAVTSIRTATGVSWTATGGAIASFRYIVMFDDTHVSNLLLGWWDYGSQVSLAAAESFTVAFGASVLTIT